MSASKKTKKPGALPSPPPRPTGAPPASQGPPSWLRLGLLLTLALAAFGVSYAFTRFSRSSPAAPSGMVWIPGGEFTMGTEGSGAQGNEQPAHPVKLDGFWMDEHEVTNAQFRAFVEATGYVTTAEQAPDWEVMKKTLPPGTPKPPADKLVPGSLVFNSPQGRVREDDVSGWWTWTPGACWKHPEGPGSDLSSRDDHPVVHVSWDDTSAYVKWAGKRLPTEAEWEYACRGGLAGKRFPWGDDPPTDTDGSKANIWQGDFPYKNTRADGWERTAPAKTYPPNGYGLYEMGGNVWEWCSDWYRADAYVGRKGVTENPQGPGSFWDPAEPLVPKRVTRGGSFLCHVKTCVSYRPAARRGTSTDTGMSHIGFRCALSGPGPAR